MELTISNYQYSLHKIKEVILTTQQKVNYEKVVMCWQVGKIIKDHLAENRGSNYGNNFFEQLTNDTGISKTSLYQMQNFHQSYPTLPEPTTPLNWSQYRHLSTVKDQRSRNSLEITAIRNNLSANDLLKEIKQKKHESKLINQGYARLDVTRGQLFTYKVKKLRNKEKIFLDFGFNIFGEALHQSFDEGTIVSSITSNGQFGLKELDTPKSQLHTYKAYVDKVVDGDTLNVIIDLGFNIRHKEIIRLAKINAPEKKTQAGEKSTRKLQDLLKNVEFIIIKTNKTDIYGRYIGDVFFSPEHESNPQKVADEGSYLNQMLLDLGLAEVYT